MRARLLALSTAILVLAAACGGSGSGSIEDQTTIPTDDTAVAVTTQDQADPTTDRISSDAPEADDGAGVAAAASSQVVTDLVTKAGSDGDVTNVELTEILTAVGIPESQATCEGNLLAELGFTDPTDVDALRAAAGQLTEDQRVQLSTCMAAAG